MADKKKDAPKEEKEQKEPKEPRVPKEPKPIRQPKSKKEIDVAFVNRFFAYKGKVARYNAAKDPTEANKATVEAVKKEHEEWLDTVISMYGGEKPTAEKTKEIIRVFADKYYKDLPEVNVVGKFK